MSGAKGVARRRPAPSRAKTPPLSDLDLRILSLLSRHRVMTQTQLAAASPAVPIRTLRYRCSRLARQGLLGRTRPYRERGSAPNHLWPTRKGEASVCGGPPPRGGERREPNPLFLAHAAGLTEVWVALGTSLPEGAKLTRFEREGEAREPFTVPGTRKERAIAPDVLIEITDADGGTLLAFVELDMGTMSHRRLRQKASGYAAYAEASAWREHHPFCPALLFLTTTETRARSFLAAMHKEGEKDSLLLTCASDLARQVDRIANGPCWLHNSEKDHSVDLLAVLSEERRPFDEERERLAADRREADEERKRLLTDPEALRAHLDQWWGSGPRLGHLGQEVATGVAITLGRSGPPDEVEARGLLALGATFDDPLRPLSSEVDPTARQRRVLEELVEHHRESQLRLIAGLAARHGEGPALREARRRIERSGILPAPTASRLEQRAVEDERSRGEQERLACDYLTWREQEARRHAKAQGFTARLRTRPQDFFDEVDLRSLRLCRSCGEIAYPDPERAREEHGRPEVAHRCHYCGTRALARLREEVGG
jgi:hypothetical protein